MSTGLGTTSTMNGLSEEPNVITRTITLVALTSALQLSAVKFTTTEMICMLKILIQGLMHYISTVVYTYLSIVTKNYE